MRRRCRVSSLVTGPKFLLLNDKSCVDFSTLGLGAFRVHVDRSVPPHGFIFEHWPPEVAAERGEIGTKIAQHRHRRQPP